MPDALFVIPCRFDPVRPVIFECVEAIQRHHKNPQIIVVDSDSEDRSYLNWCNDHGCDVADIGNHGYAHGAFTWAQSMYSDVDYFYMMFDSLIVQSNLDAFQNQQLTVIRHWSNNQHDWGWDAEGVHLSQWGGEQLERMGVSFPSNYMGIMGPMMFVQRRVVDRLGELGYWETEVTNGYHHAAMERVAGICLQSLDYDVASASLQGVHTRHQDPYDETYVKKLDLGRP